MYILDNFFTLGCVIYTCLTKTYSNMKRTEIILCSVTLVSIVLIKCAVPLSNELGVMSFLFLALHYLLFTTFLVNDIPFKGIFKKESYQRVNGGQIVLGVFAGNALSIVSLSILFGTLVWTGYQVMMFAALSQ